MTHWTRLAIALLAAPTLAACAGGEAPEAEVEQPAAAADGAPAAHDMAGMQMGGGGLAEVRAHIQAMEGETGEQLRTNLAQHRQTVANAIAQMNREMGDMNMAADQEWTSTIEAIRDDLRRLPEMSAQELESFMPEHRQRVVRLLDMHETMMRDMGM